MTSTSSAGDEPRCGAYATEQGIIVLLVQYRNVLPFPLQADRLSGLFERLCPIDLQEDCFVLRFFLTVCGNDVRGPDRGPQHHP